MNTSWSPISTGCGQEATAGPRTTVTISSDVFFDFDSAALTPAARRVVDETGRQLAVKPGAITFVGHTDRIGTRALTRRCRRSGRPRWLSS